MIVYWGCTTFGCERGFNGTEESMPRSCRYCPSCGGELHQITKHRKESDRSGVPVSDTIRGLRELLDKAGSTPWKWCPSLDLHMLSEIAFEDGDSVPWGGTEDEGHLFVAAVNALPALLDIAEAAKLAHEGLAIVNDAEDRYFGAALMAEGLLRDALARLDGDRS